MYILFFTSMAADELDSYMYQTVGHNAIDLYAQAMELPLYRGTIQGSSVSQGKVYIKSEGDEVEDLYKLLKKIKVASWDHIGGGARGPGPPPQHFFVEK